MKEKIIGYLKSRSVAFFVALAMAIISIIVAIVYPCVLSVNGEISEYLSYIPLILLVAGAVIFIALSIFDFSNLGTAIMSMLDFAAFLIFVGTIYGYPLEKVMVISNIFDIDGFMTIIISAIMMLIGAIGSNVCAWLRQAKKM